MRKIRIKKKLNFTRKNFYYIGTYRWPDAHCALKSYYLFSFYSKKYKVSPYVSKAFIRDVVSGLYDNIPEIKFMENHPKKDALQSIAHVSFQDLLRIRPELIVTLILERKPMSLDVG